MTKFLKPSVEHLINGIDNYCYYQDISGEKEYHLNDGKNIEDIKKYLKISAIPQIVRQYVMEIRRVADWLNPPDKKEKSKIFRLFGLEWNIKYDRDSQQNIGYKKALEDVKDIFMEVVKEIEKR